MVSTRGLKIKFAEGEKVLCYEPDPAKTKVLYDSKVLSIESKKDKHGKKILHFLIHFQGWSSTWDRVVTEDLLLKDTEENRQLQRELAKRAQLIARGGNLYRRERKWRKKCAGQGPAKRSEDSMSQQSDSEASDPEDSHPLILLPLPESLRQALEYDELAITSHNKVLNLPAEPNIVTILESFLKEYAQSLIKQAPAKRPYATRPSATTMTVDSYSRSMNLCREVVDGVRVFVDFTLPQILLYRLERGQLHTAMTKGIEREIKLDLAVKIKDEVEEGEEVPSKKALLDCGSAASTEPVERRRSLRSHQGTSASGSQVNSEPLRMTRRQSGDTAVKPPPDLNGVPSKGDPVRPMNQRENEVLEKILSWSLVPERVKQAKPPYASILYGATHLTRALLKLPELIQKSEYSEAKTNLVMDLLSSILKYLEDHPEWFGETQYRENIYPPPPPQQVEVVQND